MNKLLISHVWNDELYLRGWLKHHVSLFDHGVIILYESTDTSESIIKEEVPSWTIVKPDTPKLTTGALENQVQTIESKYSGWWKMCLTVTEYLLVNNLDEMLQKVSSDVLLISGYGLVDSLEEINISYNKDVPVFKQRYYGFDMMKVFILGRNNGRRLLHCRTHGAYKIGRHWTNHKDAIDYPDIKLVRAFYSPYNEEGILRKLNMGKNISDKDIKEGRCWQHFMTREQIQKEYEELLKQSGPLNL